MGRLQPPVASGYQPRSGAWQLVTNVATLNGLFVVTLAITYLVPVISAVVERRQMAAMITALGTTAEEVVVSVWNGRDFGFLDRQLPHIAEKIMLTAERHIAYPVLHDFRSRDPGRASERTLAMLDDVLTILDHGVDPSLRLEPATVCVTRAAIDGAKKLMPVGIRETEQPPLPDIAMVAAHGIPRVVPGSSPTLHGISPIADVTLRRWWPPPAGGGRTRRPREASSRRGERLVVGTLLDPAAVAVPARRP